MESTLSTVIECFALLRHVIVTTWPCLYSFIVLPTAALFVLLTLMLSYHVHFQLRQIRAVPAEIPWIGTGDHRIFPKLRATLAMWKKGREYFDEAWEKYSKDGKTCIVPSIHWPSIVLPQSEVSWLVSQPEHIISDDSVQDEVLGLDWLGHGPSMASVHDFSVIRRDLTRQVVASTPDIMDEIQYSCSVHFGQPTDRAAQDQQGWYDVRLVKAVTRCMLGIGNRGFVGAPLCRDRWLHRWTTWWVVAVGLTALLRRAFLPKALERLVMPVLRLPALFARWEAARYLVPEIEKRVAVIRERGKLGDGSGEKGELLGGVERKNDFMQWVIESAAARPDPREMEATHLAHKLIFFNMFTVHTIQATFTSVLATILSQPNAEQIFTELRSEAEKYLLQLEPDTALTRKMVKHDSAIREVMRFEPMADEGLMREIVAPGGIMTPSGVFLPQGSYVSVCMRQMQRDREGLGGFRAFRFCENDTEKPLSAVQISDRFLSFGLGKHACPGRFFAVHVMKLMLGYLVMHYDFEPLKETPKMVVIASANIVSERTNIRMRKRQDQDVVAKT